VVESGHGRVPRLRVFESVVVSRICGYNESIHQEGVNALGPRSCEGVTPAGQKQESGVGTKDTWAEKDGQR
jgi:hypothetical protein